VDWAGRVGGYRKPAPKEPERKTPQQAAFMRNTHTSTTHVRDSGEYGRSLPSPPRTFLRRFSCTFCAQEPRLEHARTRRHAYRHRGAARLGASDPFA
jgi:hypothetical protein